jgi:hypothetical protein
LGNFIFDLFEFGLQVCKFHCFYITNYSASMKWRASLVRFSFCFSPRSILQPLKIRHAGLVLINISILKASLLFSVSQAALAAPLAGSVFSEMVLMPSISY